MTTYFHIGNRTIAKEKIKDFNLLHGDDIYFIDALLSDDTHQQSQPFRSLKDCTESLRFMQNALKGVAL